MRRMMAASRGAGSSGSRGVTVDAVTYGHDGVPLGAAKRQFNDLDGAVRSWKLGGSFYREPTPGAIELLAVDADGAGRWTDYSGAYFATAEDMAVNDQPGEPGPEPRRAKRGQVLTRSSCEMRRSRWRRTTAPRAASTR